MASSIEPVVAGKTSGHPGFFQPVQEMLDTLIQHGTARYGIVHSPIWMSILDIHPLDSPHHPLALDEDIRVQRRGRGTEWDSFVTGWCNCRKPSTAYHPHRSRC